VDAGRVEGGEGRVSLKIRQDSTHQGGNWWKWSVWIEGGSREMAAVDHVVYTLHATFPDPVRTVRNRRTGFRLESSGWGEFELYARIVAKDGKVHQRKHWLTLDGEARPAAAGAAPPSSAGEAPSEPVAYLSAGSADAEVARHIRESLGARGIRVVTMDDAPAGLPMEAAVDRLLAPAQAAVFVLSGRPSVWTLTEIARARALSVPHLIPVMLGTATDVPEPLRGIEPLHLGSAADVERVVGQILGAVS
jgi:pYEATS domain-containing protein involved in immunity/TIR domain-containing protein